MTEKELQGHHNYFTSKYPKGEISKKDFVSEMLKIKGGKILITTLQVFY